MSFFFVQAEDGIRDVAVTGVQTCALPISHTTRGGAVDAAARLVAAELDEPGPGTLGVTARLVDVLLVYILRAWQERQIGRASCRERVESPVAAVSLKHKRHPDHPQVASMC